VSPGDIKSVLAGALALVAILVVVIRPAMAALMTLGSKLSGHERAFIGWMAPRGIVAGATASAFGLQLASAGIHGATKVLPNVFVVIFGTVVVYGLSGVPVARWLRVAGAEGTLVLIVGGHQLAVAIGSALKRAGVGVRLWAGPHTQAAARSPGLEADRGRMLVDSLNREVELEEVTDALLLSRGDDFNAIAALDLRGDLGHGHVNRVAPDPNEPDLLAPATGIDILGRRELTLAVFKRRLRDGARISTMSVDRTADSVSDLNAIPLFVVGSKGELRGATDATTPLVESGDTVIELTTST
jgi:hypothetical protein